jgi:hypothetical protein
MYNVHVHRANGFNGLLNLILPVPSLNVRNEAARSVDTSTVIHCNICCHSPEDYNPKFSTLFFIQSRSFSYYFSARQILNLPTHLEVQAASGSHQDFMDTNVLKMTTLTTLPVTVQRQTDRLLKHKQQITVPIVLKAVTVLKQIRFR